MAAKRTNTHSTSMMQFVLIQYWTFLEAVFSLIETMSSIKRMRRDFVPFSDCVQ